MRLTAIGRRVQRGTYVAYRCAASQPRLVRVRDPFGSLPAKAKGSVLVSAAEVAGAARTTEEHL